MAEILIDGALDEAAWAAATVIPLTHEWSPGDNAEPPVRTECLVTFDSANLYVAFRAFDPDPAQIRAHLADRDTAFLDDTVGFFVDTFNDQRRAFEFRVNPLGVQMEATVNDIDATEDWSWNAIWDSAGRITAEGYVVEVAVPFRQLRFPRTAEAQTWGFLALRTYPRSVLHDIRSASNLRNQNCTVCQFDTLAGFQRIETGHNLETVPTITAGRT
ncbi:MAG TPA: carbohydrate binding family 9 domain-containing protein, partial [Thermoanaerobaculia bacterium]|nr:carbohydrate binding family 9 domain-containing protein [Thermoanaerobaculia bacterium]